MCESRDEDVQRMLTLDGVGVSQLGDDQTRDARYANSNVMILYCFLHVTKDLIDFQLSTKLWQYQTTKALLGMTSGASIHRLLPNGMDFATLAPKCLMVHVDGTVARPQTRSLTGRATALASGTGHKMALPREESLSTMSPMPRRRVLKLTV